jgi:class 3 adenylate cyclase
MGDGSHTFLFTDLIGFTALTAAEGDDRAAEVAVELSERVRRLLVPHCVEEVKAMGDGLMLRSDEPSLAVRMGLAIVADLESAPGFPPVRVGIHTGRAVFRDNDWYGNTVNVAARLCSAAGAGEVLVSESTIEAAGRLHGVEIGGRRLHWLKNLTDPVPAHNARSRECAGFGFYSLGKLKTTFTPWLEGARS